MRRAVAVLLLALLGLAPTTAASGSDVVVVPGTSFPAGGTYLSWFGCAGLFEPAAAGPTPSVGADAAAPLGSRATRLAMPATGQASGPVARVDRVGGRRLVDVGPAGVGRAGRRPRLVRLIRARRGRGVVRPRRPGGHRGGVAAGPPRHRPVHLEPASTPRPVRSSSRPGRRRSPASPGPMATGPATCWPASGATGRRSCWTRSATGATTYDLEGFPVSTTIVASAPAGRARDRGDAHRRDPRRDQQPTGAPLVLEARPAGAAGFTRVGSAAGARRRGRQRRDDGDAAADDPLPVVPARHRLRRRRQVAGRHGARRPLTSRPRG